MTFRSKQRFPLRKKTGSAATKAAGDDRNLVLVDEDFQDADFEDHVWLFWQRHGRQTIAVATLVFVAIIAAIVFVEVKKMRLSSLQIDFSAAETIEQKLAFAAANENRPLAGAAYFAVGTEYSEAEKFAEAADAFGKAAAVFDDFDDFAAMRDRALVAQAASTARTGTPDSLAAAQELLKKIAASPNSDPLYRGQAMYELATIALSADDFATARLWLNEMDRSLEPANFWQERKRSLLILEPALALPETTTAAAATDATAPAAETVPASVPVATESAASVPAATESDATGAAAAPANP